MYPAYFLDMNKENMKTLLYEIRYYLAATLLVILLLPDKTDTLKPDNGKDPNSVLTHRRGQNQAVDNLSAKRTSQTVPTFLPEKDTKDTNAQSEKKTKNLYPWPNRY